MAIVDAWKKAWPKFYKRILFLAYELRDVPALRNDLDSQMGSIRHILDVARDQGVKLSPAQFDALAAKLQKTIRFPRENSTKKHAERKAAKQALKTCVSKNPTPDQAPHLEPVDQGHLTSTLTRAGLSELQSKQISAIYKDELAKSAKTERPAPKKPKKTSGKAPDLGNTDEAPAKATNHKGNPAKSAKTKTPAPEPPKKTSGKVPVLGNTDEAPAKATKNINTTHKEKAAKSADTETPARNALEKEPVLGDTDEVPAKAAKQHTTTSKEKPPKPTRTETPAPKQPKKFSDKAPVLANIDDLPAKASNKATTSTPVDILFVDNWNGTRAIMAQAYMELIRVWTANTTRRWLFRRVDSAGLYVGTSSPGEGAQLADGEELVLGSGSASQVALEALSGDRYYFQSDDEPKEKEKALKRVQSHQPQGVKDYMFAAYRYILCFDTHALKALRQRAEKAREADAKNKKPQARILLLPGTEEAIRTASSLEIVDAVRSAIKVFLTAELGWTRPAHGIADGPCRTRFIYVKHRWQTTKILAGSGELRRQSQCDIHLAWQSKELGFAVAIVGPSQALADAEKMVRACCRKETQ